MQLHTGAGEHGRALITGSRRPFADEARLAHAGLTAHQEERRNPGRGASARGIEPCQVLEAADETALADCCISHGDHGTDHPSHGPSSSCERRRTGETACPLRTHLTHMCASVSGALCRYQEQAPCGDARPGQDPALRCCPVQVRRHFSLIRRSTVPPASAPRVPRARDESPAARRSGWRRWLVSRRSNNEASLQATNRRRALRRAGRPELLRSSAVGACRCSQWSSQRTAPMTVK